MPPNKERGEKVGGKPPQAPTPTPEPGDQYNFTDPESRIMKAGSGNHFEQSYNAQAAVEVESRLIVGERVSQAPNDKQELVPTLAAIPAEAGNLAAALVDSGFFSEKAVGEVERAGAGPVVYAAVEKTGHHRSVADLEKKPEPEPPGGGRERDRSDAPPPADHGGQERFTSCDSKRSSRCSGSSSRCWGSGSSGCAAGRKWRWNGRWSAWPTT